MHIRCITRRMTETKKSKGLHCFGDEKNSSCPLLCMIRIDRIERDKGRAVSALKAFNETVKNTSIGKKEKPLFVLISQNLHYPGTSDQTVPLLNLAKTVKDVLGDHLDLKFVVFERFPQGYPPHGFYVAENVPEYKKLPGKLKFPCGLPPENMIQPTTLANRTFIDKQGMGLGLPMVLVPVWSALREYTARGTHFETRKNMAGKVPDCTHIEHPNGWFAILQMTAESITEVEGK